MPVNNWPNWTLTNVMSKPELRAYDIIGYGILQLEGGNLVGRSRDDDGGFFVFIIIIVLLFFIAEEETVTVD
jgi:hypothetical protein